MLIGWLVDWLDGGLIDDSYLFQLIVVVKYFFQFGFFPWTTSAYRGINADRPFALPNIIGVEKKYGYVLFDLIQMLALFFHRSILKVLAGMVVSVLHHTGYTKAQLLKTFFFSP